MEFNNFIKLRVIHQFLKEKKFFSLKCSIVLFSFFGTMNCTIHKQTMDISVFSNSFRILSVNCERACALEQWIVFRC